MRFTFLNSGGLGSQLIAKKYSSDIETSVHFIVPGNSKTKDSYSMAEDFVKTYLPENTNHLVFETVQLPNMDLQIIKFFRELEDQGLSIDPVILGLYNVNAEFDFSYFFHNTVHIPLAFYSLTDIYKELDD